MKRVLTAVFVLSATLSIAQQRPALQNPCDEPPSQLQMNRCASYEHKEADAHLTRVYAKAIWYMERDLSRSQKEGSGKDLVDYNKRSLANLKSAERQWLVYRDIQCNAAGELYVGGSMKPMIYHQCMTTLTNNRIADLKSIYGADGDRLLE
jgi:uncharacterized protein YecT (DUF1311 family)